MFYCAKCGLRTCRGESTDYPAGCPCLDEQTRERVNQRFKEDEENLDIFQASMRLDAQAKGTYPRIMETLCFAKELGVERVGLAFCVGLAKEADTVTRVFEHHGLTVDSVVCKCGSFKVDEFGMSNEALNRRGNEAVCDPVGQALWLEKANTQLNVVLGLCVGHDTLFFKHSAAPVTVLAVKDKVLAHNPLGAVYMADNFYRSKLFPKK
ncbi:MAG: DUF1847 domain-containing protein [Christensenellales bacterium]|jgi:uncharacterized metal-binding protein